MCCVCAHCVETMHFFRVDIFTTAPSLLQLDESRTSDLHELAAHYSISISHVLFKTDLKAAVVEALKGKGLFSSPVQEKKTTKHK